MSDAKPLVFQRDYKAGSVSLLSSWHRHIHVSKALLACADLSEGAIEEGEGWVRFRVEQGEALYRFAHDDALWSGFDLLELDERATSGRSDSDSGMGQP